jgi:hypothetical protein
LTPQHESMLNTYKRLTARQYQAALCTLGLCIDRCPQAAWNEPVAKLKFCQVAFHTLFFTDFYLGPDRASFKQQAFHVKNPDFFRDYEELVRRRQRLLYDKAGVQRYLKHCRAKVSQTIRAETVESLRAPSVQRPGLTRAELHVYNIRHVQHHAAQLSLRLRIDFGEDIPWVRYGWRDE